MGEAKQKAVSASANQAMLAQMVGQLPLPVLIHLTIAKLANDKTVEADLASIALMNYDMHARKSTLTTEVETEDAINVPEEPLIKP